MLKDSKWTPFSYTIGLGVVGVLAFLTGIQMLESFGILCVALAVIGTLTVINQFIHHRANKTLVFTSVNGFGSSLFSWGNSELGHEWIIVLFIPVLPIASYKVLSKEATGLFARKYHLIKTNFHHRQALAVYAAYLAVYILLAILIAATHKV